MSMNLKLQSSASKNQARNIELELRRIEARESKELLSIIQVQSMVHRNWTTPYRIFHFQPYLPQIYIETDSDATSLYLFFQRMASKIDLINHIVGQAHGLPDALNGPVSEVLVGICEVMFDNYGALLLDSMNDPVTWPSKHALDSLQTLRSCFEEM